MQTSALIVLINLNSYLGGGETLMVRFAQYLQQRGMAFLCVCAEGGYAHADLRSRGVDDDALLAIATSPDYYYLSRRERAGLIGQIAARIGDRAARVVTFCMRDLYTGFALSREMPQCAIVHLILHIQDDLYVGQTLFEKVVYRLFGRRRFGNTRAIDFNRRLLSLINDHGGLICMADLIAQAWHRNFGLSIAPSHIVPLPSFVAGSEPIPEEGNNKRIIWIGRLVDFKLPALLAMVDFLAQVPDYILTIVGDGDRSLILERMKLKGVAAERVHFMGEVPYANLPNVVRGHSIGYAMGTSLVELSRFRIPVIVALASYEHTPFRDAICGGLFFDKPKGCDGSDLALSSEEEIGVPIAEAVASIESDWLQTARACYEYARSSFSLEENFAAYASIVQSAQWLSGAERAIRIPSASLARGVLFAAASLRK